MKRIYVWFGDRLPVGVHRMGPALRRPGCVAHLLAERGRPLIALHGQGQHHLPLGDLAGHPAQVNGQGDKAVLRPPSGRSICQAEVVSSEFSTMSGSKLASSRGHVIYVRDFLAEFGPDALRYFIAVAGPENQDSDFTWEEFVRRINYELANRW